MTAGPPKQFPLSRATPLPSLPDPARWQNSPTASTVDQKKGPPVLSALPAAGPVAHAAYADGSLPPVAVLVQAIGLPGDPEPVALSVITHPRWAHLLTQGGAMAVGAGRWKVGKTAKAQLLAALGSRWRAGSSSRAAGVKVTSTGLTLTLCPHTAGPALALALSDPGCAHPVSGLAAHAAVEDARKLGLPVFRTGDTAALTRISEAADRTVVATSAPGMPAVLNLAWGPGVQGPVPEAIAAKDLPALKLPTGTRLLVRDDAADAVSTATATAPGLPGLHPWQDLFVGRYQATSRGMVNALAPGLGKSAAALAAVRQRHGHGPALVLVLAPPTSRTQWLDEADRYFPGARMWDAGTGPALLEALRAAATRAAQAPAAPIEVHIVLTTPDLLARAGTDTASGDGGTTSPPFWDDLIVDEGTFLAQEGASRTKAAWAARTRSGRAMVLTGTPTQRRVSELEPLAAFAFGDPDLFAARSLTQYDAFAPTAASRLGAYLHEHHAAVPAPAPEHAVPLLAPSAVDAVVDACVRARLEQLARANPATVSRQLNLELAAARLGYADPVALLTSKYALAQDVRSALTDSGITQMPGMAGTKLVAVAAVVRGAVADQGQVLVFGDFLSPLESLAEVLRSDPMTSSTEMITSRTSATRREKALAAFRAGNSSVLLMSGTGHRGLNLQQAGHVVHLDLPDTAAALLQRTARSARLGSTKTVVTSTSPVLEGSIEDRLADLIGARGLRPADRQDQHAWLVRLLRPALRHAA